MRYRIPKQYELIDGTEYQELMDELVPESWEIRIIGEEIIKRSKEEFINMIMEGSIRIKDKSKSFKIAKPNKFNFKKI